MISKNTIAVLCAALIALSASAVMTVPASASEQTESQAESQDGSQADSQDDSTPAEEEPDLDKDNLEDGKYTLTAEMIKLDKYDYSMFNNAINHSIRLEVVDGEYYITVQFKGLAIFNQFGYLMDLSYYDKGYTFNDYGVPQGTVIPAEVLSTQKDSDGNDVVDQYNAPEHLYPELLRFKVVDGGAAEYIPLQVFVPIMEAIAEGTGTQDVYMRVDWSKLEKVADDEEFIPEAPEKQSPELDFTDADTKVSVHGDKGVFPDGTRL